MSTSSLSGLDDYYIMDCEAQSVPPGSDGLVMLPHLAGSMAPDVKSTARGVFYGISLMHGKPHFIRAVMESIAYILRRNLDALVDMGINVDQIRSLGGGSKSKVWNQIKADVLGKTLVTTHSTEAACLGVAILAGKAIGWFDSVEGAVEGMIQTKDQFQPQADHRQVYDTGYQAYKDLFSALDTMFDQYYNY